MYFCSKSSALLLLVSKWCYAMRKLLLMPLFSASGLKQTPYLPCRLPPLCAGGRRLGIAVPSAAILGL